MNLLKQALKVWFIKSVQTILYTYLFLQPVNLIYHCIVNECYNDRHDKLLLMKVHVLLYGFWFESTISLQVLSIYFVLLIFRIVSISFFITIFIFICINSIFKIILVFNILIYQFILLCKGLLLSLYHRSYSILDNT